MPRDPNEPVRLNRIYTGGGDKGKTSLGNGARVSKLDPRIAAYGAVDELNSTLGVALACGVPERIRPPLERLQNELFDVGADLCVPIGVEGRLRVTEEAVAGIERLCDEFNEGLAELRSFVLPGGTEAAARLHVARTIARRAELRALEAHEAQGVNPQALVYLNRTSDLLFILARTANAEAGRDEPLWRPGG
ncbi:MAG TPA: cob(I)yrinic acid a,c-diamide adenosyltransferase [Gaiellaceae bacterium]|nr:cob(I)yrinic acid a,c-diamide adenosyltransferase [Gaiellaceae bacterium]